MIVISTYCLNKTKGNKLTLKIRYSNMFVKPIYNSKNILLEWQWDIS